MTAAPTCPPMTIVAPERQSFAAMGLRSSAPQERGGTGAPAGGLNSGSRQPCPWADQPAPILRGVTTIAHDLTSFRPDDLLAARVERDLPWVQVAPGAPYFVTEDGAPWTPVGQNDAITWPELEGLFRRRDLEGVERHIAWLRDHGVTVLRLMLEYAHGENRYLETPVGRFAPNMVRLWDDLFAICARQGMRLLLTPFDTFWMWLRWKRHPYNRANGGPCKGRSRILLCPDTMTAIKARMSFVVERWGGSGVVFAWDLWNEMHPAQMGDSAEGFARVVTELSEHVRALETRLYGRTHPQTVSLFGPILYSHPEVADTIFRHSLLDFASTHLYAAGTIDHPRDTVAPALATADLVREAVNHAPPDRPYLDSEHGPIHFFKDKKKVLPEDFDDEYFRHIQWAHLASGGAGGGMRWPNRRPHTLTPGMRRAQAALAGFLPLIDWTTFRRANRSPDLRVSAPGVRAMGCADDRQAVAWLLRTDRLDRRGRVVMDVPPIPLRLKIPGLRDGAYEAVAWNTREGRPEGTTLATSRDGALVLNGLQVATDLALAIRTV
ncbi:hypothetical protein [Rubellimicrobium roseum]|uniref:Mannan endo-1,4-beta-mannosidase n=1 Tax=Rubellimicrobium roseum TaxID=687525 RepID=A0A5C4NBE5_9RHOB|nr:hypothetical protein [Rubellimicrobium roseum]TNC62470.1 hypothetical protein FHG71_20270 [Rubellimicrobium roseum]